MTVIGSLCSGYGGLDMALSAATGGRVAWHVEHDKHPSAILAHRFPGVPNYGDVTSTDWTAVEPVDWLTAGYPCQPFSHAGLRKGTDDDRHLWPDVAIAIGVLRPRHVLLENVAAHLRVGFDEVLADLAGLGYDARWGLVRASDAGAPHGRARLFVVATDTSDDGQQRRRAARLGWAGPENGDLAAPDTNSDGRSGIKEQHSSAPTRLDSERRGHAHGRSNRSDGRTGESEGLADADSAGLEGGEPAGRHVVPAWGAYESAVRRWERVTGQPAPRPTEPAHRGDGERLNPRFVEWMMGLPAGWVTDVPGVPRSAQLKALGNGVVPQQAALAYALLATTHNAEALSA